MKEPPDMKSSRSKTAPLYRDLSAHEGEEDGFEQIPEYVDEGDLPEYQKEGCIVRVVRRLMLKRYCTVSYGILVLLCILLFVWGIMLHSCVFDAVGCVDVDEHEGTWFEVLDVIITGALTVEIILRIIATKDFFSSWFNWLDLIILLLCIIGAVLAYALSVHSDDELVANALLLSRYLLQFLRIYAILKQHRRRRAISLIQKSTTVVFGPDEDEVNSDEDENLAYHPIVDGSFDASNCRCGAAETQSKCICGRGGGGGGTPTSPAPGTIGTSLNGSPVLLFPPSARPFSINEPSFGIGAPPPTNGIVGDPFEKSCSNPNLVATYGRRGRQNKRKNRRNQITKHTVNDNSTIFIPVENKPTLWERTARLLRRGTRTTDGLDNPLPPPTQKKHSHPRGKKKNKRSYREDSGVTSTSMVPPSNSTLSIASTSTVAVTPISPTSPSWTITISGPSSTSPVTSPGTSSSSSGVSSGVSSTSTSSTSGEKPFTPIFPVLPNYAMLEEDEE